MNNEPMGGRRGRVLYSLPQVAAVLSHQGEGKKRPLRFVIASRCEGNHVT